MQPWLGVIASPHFSLHCNSLHWWLPCQPCWPRSHLTNALSILEPRSHRDYSLCQNRITATWPYSLPPVQMLAGMMRTFSAPIWKCSFTIIPYHAQDPAPGLFDFTQLSKFVVSFLYSFFHPLTPCENNNYCIFFLNHFPKYIQCVLCK